MKHLESRPLERPFFSHGTFILMAIMGTGFAFGILRLLIGLGAVTNLDNSYPWGIWIAIDVACGVALAAGGFTTAALVDIFGKKEYHALLRPAVLTAWLGYLMVSIGLMFDLGRYWNIWRPMFNWQGNSVMFELAMCVMAYLMVLSMEMAPSVLEGIKGRISGNKWGADILGKIEKPVIMLHSWVKILLPILIIAGVVLSCMHQSSLGTLMVIAPTKLSALWHTTWLPLLFLLSAIMVGFPMVIIEALLSSKGLKRPSEIQILGPLASKIPWFIALYAIFKFADLALRRSSLDFLEHPGSTVSFAIEVIMGLLVPFILLSMKTIRRSSGWLFTSCFLVLFGVALNRINVFLVGYHPAFAEKVYYPSIGEIALTCGLIATIVFLYRFFVNYFPILPVMVENEPVGADLKTPEEESVSPKVAWVTRGAAVLFILSFIILYVGVHKKAITHSELTYGEVFAAKKAHPEVKKSSALTHLFRPDKYRNFYILNSPLFQAPEQKDAANEGKTAPSGRNTNYYEPVRFSHRAHDQAVGGNCGICHHRVSDGDDDRVGEDLKEMHTGIEIRIGGACTTCHEDLKEKEFQKCSACHVASNEKDYPARIGLKGAYHRQCIGCHEEQPPMANAPTDCKSCHHPLTPDHKPLLALTTPPGPLALTSKCLECHPGVGDDVLKSAHWNWKGLTPAISGHEHSIDTGLFKLIDNYTITMSPELVDSNVFHIGYNTGDKRTSFTGVNNLDCLVCHDTTGTYEKDEKRGGLPMEGNDLSAIAESVGRPSRSNCGKCHFHVRAPNAKHGDLEPALANPTPEMDTHMGMVGMRCQDCHTTTNHRIAGLSFLAPVTEDRVGCVKCHGSSPHGITGQLSRHLDDHVKAVACETCHIPMFAHETPTLLSTDFSTAGQDRSVEKDSNGMPLYDKKFGSLTWGKQVTPTYRWFDGNRKAYIQGDEIDASEVVELNTPLGEKYIPESRIYPFKVHSANQPYDSETNLLVPVKFKDGFWNHFDWNRAIKDGAAIAGMEYSGKYGFVKTTMYTSIHHEVAPARKALGCADCHSVPAVTCIRCHQSAKGMDQPQHTHMVYPGVKNRFNFKSLGYEDDPAVIGGRFIRKLGRGNPK